MTVSPDKTNTNPILSCSAGHRRAVVLAGARAWGQQAARCALETLGIHDACWFGADESSVADSLGREFGGIVFDAWAGFDPDALGAIAGTLRGNGVFFILAPPLAEWPVYPDPQRARLTVFPHGPEAVGGRFLTRLAAVISADKQAVRVCEQPTLPVIALPALPGHLPPPGPDGCRTADQQQAVEAVLTAARGHRRRPVVLLADRGRGKSAALGIAAARLLQQPGELPVIVTGPSREAVRAVFQHANEARGLIFLPPDELARHAPPARLLLVDEAAAIPAPLLAALLRRYARMVFATTVQGYEGTGRGFLLRFAQVLDRETPGWRQVRLNTPIRWADNDPLERLLFRALLLDAEAAPDQALAGLGECAIGRVDRDLLAADETTLAQTFGLLVQAHYRTRPLDLRHLLDGPNVSVYLARWQGQVAGVVLLAEEGGATLAAAMQAGRCRPRGHLLPEALAAQCGAEDAPGLRAWRIVRLAVHPAARRRGLGRALLAQVRRDAAQAGVDYLGASFGASVDLLDFWAACGFFPVSLGVKRNAASGAHSALALAPLSAAGKALFERLRARFLDHLPHALSDPLRGLEPALAAWLWRGAQPAVCLDASDRQDLRAFAEGRRTYETCLAAVWKLACLALAAPSCALEPAQRDALIIKVLQKNTWPDAAAALGLSGRAAVEATLRSAVAKLESVYNSPPGQVKE